MKISLFQDVLKQISNKSVRDFTIQCLKDAPEILDGIPASTSAKYHPPTARKEGGLVWHVNRACNIANMFFNAYQFTNVDIRGDIVLSALLLHDIGKKEKYGSDYSSYKNHPITASKMISKHKSMLPEKVFNLIQSCVIHHMGCWTPNSVKKPISKYNLLELIVYNSDYISTQPTFKLNSKG